MIDGLIEFLNQLNIFDIVFLIVLIYFITQCFVKGFTLSLISFMKWGIFYDHNDYFSSKSSTYSK